MKNNKKSGGFLNQDKKVLVGENINNRTEYIFSKESNCISVEIGRIIEKDGEQVFSTIKIENPNYESFKKSNLQTEFLKSLLENKNDN